MAAGDIAHRWQELQGSLSWAGLLDPLDLDLRANVIAYGELAEAAYDVFNSDAESAEDQCMYSCADLLAASGVSHPEYYTVTKFLYATCRLPWDESSSSVDKALFVQPVTELEQEEGLEWWYKTNWIGYVAVATDKGVKALGRRDIVVAWRGTAKLSEVIKDVLNSWLVSAETLLGRGNFKDAKVHHGFLSVYTTAPRLENHEEEGQTDDISVIKTSARTQAKYEVNSLMEVYKDDVTSITVTGHSLGASLAILNAVDMVANHVNINVNALPCPVTAIVFASPLIGNSEFKRAFASFPELRALGVINKPDKVPTLPPAHLGYVNPATATLPIDTRRSPYLRPGNMWTYHNLEVYLHGVAGDNGASRDFTLMVHRDLELVNKGTDALIEKYPVPANWWATNYKGKGKDKDVVGRWKLDYFKDE